MNLNIERFPVCSICNFSEQRAKCDIFKDDKGSCGLVLCKRCQQKNPNKICEGCKRSIKNHRFRNIYKDKIKKQIGFRFESEFNVRNEWQNDKYSKVDLGMIHILAALFHENKDNYEKNIRRDVKRLVEEIQKKNNIIQFEVRGLPICIGPIQNQVSPAYDGSEACGYIKDDNSKGICQIIVDFQETE